MQGKTAVLTKASEKAQYSKRQETADKELFYHSIQNLFVFYSFM